MGVSDVHEQLHLTFNNKVQLVNEILLLEYDLLRAEAFFFHFQGELLDEFLGVV